jgi:hypothetical protein
MMRLRLAELRFSYEIQKEEKTVKMAIWFKILAQKRNLDKEPSQEDSMVVTRLRVEASLWKEP